MNMEKHFKDMAIADDVALRNIEQVRVRVLPDGRVTRRDAAIFLGLSKKTLAMWAIQGKGPLSIRIGGRVYYRLSDLVAFIQGGEQIGRGQETLGALPPTA
jgi:hypothetical protein